MPLIIVSRCSTHSKVDYGDLNITQAHTDGETFGKKAYFNRLADINGNNDLSVRSGF